MGWPRGPARGRAKTMFWGGPGGKQILCLKPWRRRARANKKKKEPVHKSYYDQLGNYLTTSWASPRLVGREGEKSGRERARLVGTSWDLYGNRVD